jgi:hypothetical protein
MNYIKQLNYFWLQQQKHGLCASDTVMYMYLLHTCNIQNWDNPVTVSNTIMKEVTGLKSYNGLKCVRERLVNAGLIRYKTIRGNASVVYEIYNVEDKNFEYQLVENEQVTEQVSEEVTEQVSEQVTEQVTEEVTEQVTEEVTAQVSEEVTEHPIYNNKQNKTEPNKTINKNITVGNKQFKNTTASRWLQQHKQAYMDELLSTQLRSLTAQQIFDVMDAETNLYHFRDENHVCNYFRRTGERILEGAFKKPPNPQADTTYSTNTFEYVKPKNIIKYDGDPEEYYRHALDGLRKLNGK